MARYIAPRSKMITFWTYFVTQHDRNSAGFSHRFFMLSIPVTSENINMINILFQKQTYYSIKAYSCLQTSEKLAILDNAQISLFPDRLPNTIFNGDTRQPFFMILRSITERAACKISSNSAQQFELSSVSVKKVDGHLVIRVPLYTTHYSIQRQTI